MMKIANCYGAATVGFIFEFELDVLKDYVEEAFKSMEKGTPRPGSAVIMLPNEPKFLTERLITLINVVMKATPTECFSLKWPLSGTYFELRMDTSKGIVCLPDAQVELHTLENCLRQHHGVAWPE